METNVIYNEDCIGENGMCRLPDNSIDMILADLPYGTTDCKWDSIIPLKPLWKKYKRIIKENGAIVLTASQPFTTKLIQSNIKWYKYEWIWQKNAGSNFGCVKYQPMKEHENILVFGNGKVNYYPIMEKRKGEGKERIKYNVNYNTNTEVYQNGSIKNEMTSKRPNKRYPSSVQKFNRERGLHPTQKPVELFEYLIKTYTQENEVVLDNVMGSGTTAVACLKTNRKFIGFEKEEKYYNIALKRIGKFDKKYYEQLPEEEKPKQMQMF